MPSLASLVGDVMGMLVRHKYRILSVVLMLTAAFLALCFWFENSHMMQISNNAVTLQKSFLKETVNNVIRDIDNERETRNAYYLQILSGMSHGLDAAMADSPDQQTFCDTVNGFFGRDSDVNVSHVVVDLKTGQVLCDEDKVLSDGYSSVDGLHREFEVCLDFRRGDYLLVFGLSRKTAERLGREHLYLPSTFSFDEIEQQELRLCQALDLPVPDFAAERAACVAELAKTRAVVGDAPVAVDAVVHPRPFGLARLLIEQGFNVSEVYLDGVNGEEEAELDWLRVNAPELQLSSTILPDLRVAPRTRGEKTLAIGPKAAWFTGSGYFVNMVFGGGLWGFAGVRTMARLMREAWAEEKDTRDLVPRKGLGCVSCI